MRNQLAKALNALWTIALGGYLGLTAGLIIGITTIFQGAEKIAASPGVEPYSDPMFAAFHHKAVAGYTGQILFARGGITAIILLGLAAAAWTARTVLILGQPGNAAKGAGLARAIALAGAVLFMGLGTAVTVKINASWPGLYDTAATPDELATRRADFDQLHQRSSRVVTIAWLCGLVALGVSPWCKELTPQTASGVPE
ncbi:MAG: hypothetical protein AAGA29_11235 [Planctomycetota bacterium]